jgi:hypothetical protein
MYHRVCQNLDERLSTILIFCDISKAFDRVWHEGLIKKLKSHGISGDLLIWFKNYFSGRRQFVFVNNELSDSGLVKAGVPQGSVLSPLLFLLYINDITDNLGNLARLFADDTSLSYSGKNLDQWAKTWLVDFNPKKTKALISNNINIPELNIRFNDESVELVDNHKHLGVTFVSAICI